MRAPLLRLCFAALFAILPAVRASAAGGDVREMVAKVLDAYGGRAALQRVRAYRLEGTLFHLRRHDESPTIRVFERPDRFKVLIGYEGAYEVRVVDSLRGWRNESGGPLEPASGAMLDAMVLQAARAGVPWILAEHEADARWVGDSEEEGFRVDGIRLTGIEIPLREGLVLRAYVDPRTHYVMVSQGLIERPGFTTHFETWYSDFRTVDGIRFAFRETNWASGAKSAMTTVDEIRLNPKLRPGEFEPPRETAPE